MQLPPERYNVATMLEAHLEEGRSDKVAITWRTSVPLARIV